MIEDVAERFVIGSDPFGIEKLWRRIYGSGYNLRPDVSLMGVLSGFEMGRWDIIGKSLDKPVFQLLGGKVHEKLRSYTHIYPKEGDTSDVYQDPDLAAQRALEYVELGITALKFDPSGPYTIYDGRHGLEDLDRSEQFAKKIRKALRNHADLLFRSHGQFTAVGVIRLARRLEPYDPLWLEEENPAEMARVARKTTIPIATGERLTTNYEFARMLEAQAASILLMALGRGVGGILEAKNIAGIAETYYAQIAPHLHCGPIEGAANAQISTCTPNFLILESIQTWGGFHGEILKKPIQWQDGYVIPPTELGLGVEFNEAVADANPYTGTRLHLEMADEVAV